MRAYNPIWANSEHTMIDIILDHPTYGEIPFTADPDDVEPHGRELFARAVAGEFGEIQEFVPQEIELIPISITRRQCAIEMLYRGLITNDEAIAMASSSTPPALIENIFNTFAEPEKTIARIDFSANSYLRNNLLLNILMTNIGASGQDIDRFFIDAAKH